MLKHTSRKRLRRSLASFTEWCKANRHRRMEDLFKDVNAQLRGHYQYYGVRGNYASLAEHFDQASRRLFKWLNRRSQKKSYTLRGFEALLERFHIARPRITEQPYVRPVVA